MDFLEKILSLFWPVRPPRTTPVSPAPSPPVPVSADPPVPVVPPAPPVPIGPQADPANQRKWRLTYYYISDQNAWSGPQTVPVYDKNKAVLARVEAGYFAQMSLEGTGKNRDGRLLNVAGANVPVAHEDYASVWEHHKKYLAKRAPGYSGLVVKNDIVVAAAAYHVVPADKIGKGYGTLRGIPLEPFRTLAADIGMTQRSDPKWKGKGGVVPPLSKVFIKEFVGLKCPDGKGGFYIHDGWFTVTDTGGGIFGAHFDVFVGTKQLVAQVKIPSPAHIWYEGITERVPVNYTYGLVDS